MLSAFSPTTSPPAGSGGPLSPRAEVESAWHAAEASLEAEAEVIVRGTDAQLASLRDAAMSLSAHRRRDRSGFSGGAEATPSSGAGSDAAAPLHRGSAAAPAPPSPWDMLCSPRSAPVFEPGVRVSLLDAFHPRGAAGEPTPVWWDGVVTGRATSGRTDFLGRPVYRVLFDDLEIQYTAPDGERAVHVEEGGPHEVVFVSDCIAFDCDSGEELQYRRCRPVDCTGQLLLGAQVVVLP